MVREESREEKGEGKEGAGHCVIEFDEKVVRSFSPGYFPSVSRMRDSCHADSTGRLGTSNGADASFLADEVGPHADEGARGKDGGGDAEAEE